MASIRRVDRMRAPDSLDHSIRAKRRAPIKYRSIAPEAAAWKQWSALLSRPGGLTTLDDVLSLAAGRRLRVGKLLRDAGVITAQQLGAALVEQSKTGEKLGDVLVRKHLLSDRELQVALEFQKYQAGEVPSSNKLRLGEILVANGEITREQLNEALARQRKSGNRLGDELIEAGHLKPRQVQRWLAVQHHLVTAALVAALAVVSTYPADAQAGSKSASVAVSAVVLPKAVALVAYQAAQLNVTADDVARGYIDVPSGSRLVLKTTSRSGVMIDVHPRLDIFQSVQIQAPAGTVEIGPNGGTLVERVSGIGGAPVELTYRFRLAEHVRPGVYAWPLALEVRPI